MAIVDLTVLDVHSASGFVPGYSVNDRTFFSPVDNVHGVLVDLLSSATQSLIVAMYGFDDDDVNKIIVEKLADPGIAVQLTLDSTQASGTHEKALLAGAHYPASNIAIGRSERGAIMHLKVIIVDGIDVITGSTNLSDGGESKQDNEMTVRRDPMVAAKYRARVDAIHSNMVRVTDGREEEVAKEG